MISRFFTFNALEDIPVDSERLGKEVNIRIYLNGKGQGRESASQSFLLKELIADQEEILAFFTVRYPCFANRTLPEMFPRSLQG